jgi:hypothetical protein
MELTLRTLQGNAVMRDLMPTTSVQQLKQMIYDACTAGQISLEVPTPEKQRLVGAQHSLHCVQMQHAVHHLR